MQQIIIPKAFKNADELKRETPFAEMVTTPAQALRVRDAICKAIADSFAEDERRLGKSFRQKIQTQHEVKRRADILCKWFRTLRAECSYTTSRAIAIFDVALRTELDGGVFEPPKADGMYKA